MPVTHIGGKCVNTTTFRVGRRTVEAKGFDIRQPSHVDIVNKALRSPMGGTTKLKLGRFAED